MAASSNNGRVSAGSTVSFGVTLRSRDRYGSIRTTVRPSVISQPAVPRYFSWTPPRSDCAINGHANAALIKRILQRSDMLWLQEPTLPTGARALEPVGAMHCYLMRHSVDGNLGALFQLADADVAQLQCPGMIPLDAEVALRRSAEIRVLLRLELARLDGDVPLGAADVV